MTSMRIRKMTQMMLSGLLLLGCCTSFSVNAATVDASPSPIGKWTTYDLERVPRSVVQFSQGSGGTLQAKIIKILPTKNQKPTDTCTACSAPWKDKKKLGMTVIWGLKKDKDSWIDGYILDTDGGKVYRCQATLGENGRVLHMHVYAGVTMLGKTVDWIRVGK